MFADMNRRIGRGQVLKGAAAIGGLAALGAGDLTKVALVEAAGPSPVGAWMLTTVVGGGKAMDLFAFTADGLVIDSGGVSLKAPAPSNNTPITIGLGTWAQGAAGGLMWPSPSLEQA